MGSLNELNESKLLQAHAHVWIHTFNFINSMSLKCAIELDIPDIIHNHGHPMTLSKLVSALPINPKKADRVSRLMRILTHSGFFSQIFFLVDNIQEEGYVLTDASRLLLKDNLFCVSPFSLMILDPNMMKPWDSLSTWFRNDDPTPFHTAHTKMVWNLMEDDPKLNKTFNDAMDCDTHFVESIVIKQCRSVFEGLKTLVDVGGNTGTLAKAIVKEFPNLECIVLDLPHVVAGLQDNKLKYIGGDMFQEVPSANAVLLKWILHDWSDEECIQILSRCKDAITRNNGIVGKVIIIDAVVGFKNGCEEIEGSLEAQVLFDMEMLALLTGKERSEKEWEKLFLSAGFYHYKIYPILGARSLIEVYPN
ncbi:hypothetical protein ACFE04_030198 [Oxalis oulophora]